MIPVDNLTARGSEFRAGGRERAALRGGGVQVVAGGELGRGRGVLLVSGASRVLGREDRSVLSSPSHEAFCPRSYPVRDDLLEGEGVNVDTVGIELADSLLGSAA